VGVPGLIGLPAALFAAVAALFRALVLRRRWGWAALCAPALTVAADFLVSRVNPHGDFLGLAYTQADTPLLPMAAITGGWGIIAVLYAVPAAVAVFGWQLRARVVPRAGAIALAGALVAAGALPMAAAALTGSGGTAVRVADVAVGVPRDQPQLDSAAGRVLLDTIAAGLRQAAGRGAQVAVLGEASLEMRQDQMPALVERVRQAAGPGLAVSLGVVVEDPHGSLANRQVLIAPGQEPVSYDKQHLLPATESEMTPGHQTVTASYGNVRWGLLICKDLDFPWTVRATAASAQALLVPAWDFRVDGWLRSRMALVRAAENGTAMARSARSGLATISDVHGHVVAEADTEAMPTQVLVSTVRVADHETPYTRLGDWLAYLALAITAVALARLRPRGEG
jgi:apolipoprotein N-acyltransferase